MSWSRIAWCRFWLASIAAARIPHSARTAMQSVAQASACRVGTLADGGLMFVTEASTRVSTRQAEACATTDCGEWNCELWPHAHRAGIDPCGVGRDSHARREASYSPRPLAR